MQFIGSSHRWQVAPLSRRIGKAFLSEHERLPGGCKNIIPLLHVAHAQGATAELISMLQSACQSGAALHPGVLTFAARTGNEPFMRWLCAAPRKVRWTNDAAHALAATGNLPLLVKAQEVLGLNFKKWGPDVIYHALANQHWELAEWAKAHGVQHGTRDL
eukprot:TRINITY_DN6174_c0_g2_i1.p2 TRINITY_DN6174_c0_g2~~TRINITY_DN6174_c0_g2_i1.p2  ORF type:complete len:160 (-),score=50.72 TRINITY_DN6174_c0_g2_i1:1098-1577(-)